MLERLKHVFSRKAREAGLKEHLDKLRTQLPVPVFWLIGKTQSGKTSIIKHLTGAEDAEVGQGFKARTRFSRQYQFPTAEAPLMTFLDTRGLEEPGYDAREDLAKFDAMAHVVVLTVKVLDHAQENFLKQWRTIRRSRPERPAVLALTCLHEAYPQEQHVLPYPFSGEPPTWGTTDKQQDATPGTNGAAARVVPESLLRSLAAQRERFQGLYDHVVPLDLTPPEEGFNDPHYGGEKLKGTLLNALPGAYRQTMLMLDSAASKLQDLYAKHALPHILVLRQPGGHRRSDTRPLARPVHLAGHPDTDDLPSRRVVRPTDVRPALCGTGEHPGPGHAGAASDARNGQVHTLRRLDRRRHPGHDLDLRPGQGVLLLLQRRPQGTRTQA
jgi:hypothetical protein